MMKSKFKYYGICWLVVLVVFNIIVFVTPSASETVEKFDSMFWIGYVLITLMLIGNLLCSYKVFDSDSYDKFFFSLPIINVSYISLIVSMIAGSLCMAIPNIENWVGVVVCALILGIYAIAVVKAIAVSDIVTERSDDVKTKTSYMKLLKVDAEQLLNKCKEEKTRKEVNKVVEAIRYSDPVSKEILLPLELKISNKLSELTKQVETNEVVTETVDELLQLISERNKKSKVIK